MLKNVIVSLVLIGLIACGKDDPKNLVELSIEEITVISFPNFKSNGESWDSSFVATEFPADLFISISNGSELVGETTTYKPNVISPTESTFRESFFIPDLDDNIVISFWDMDDFENELIGTVTKLPRELFKESNGSAPIRLIDNDLVLEVVADFAAN